MLQSLLHQGLVNSWSVPLFVWNPVYLNDVQRTHASHWWSFTRHRLCVIRRGRYFMRANEQSSQKQQSRCWWATDCNPPVSAHRMLRPKTGQRLPNNNSLSNATNGLSTAISRALSTTLHNRASWNVHPSLPIQSRKRATDDSFMPITANRRRFLCFPTIVWWVR